MLLVVSRALSLSRGSPTVAGGKKLLSLVPGQNRDFEISTT